MTDTPTQDEWRKRLAEAFRELGLPAHMLDGVTGYLLYGLLPGGFLTAVLCDHFSEAMARADNQNADAIKGWIGLLRYLPSQSFGNRVAVDAWCKHQGLMRQERAS